MWSICWGMGVGELYGNREHMKGTNGIMLESWEVR